MNRKSIIGVLPSVNDTLTEIRLPLTYMNAVKAHGGIPFLFPFLSDGDDIAALAEKCDGFLFSGGVDIEPSLFGESKLNDTVELCEWRDTLEFQLMNCALAQDKPIFAICRGIQVLNVVLGGTLYQDLPAQMPDLKILHRQTCPYPDDGHYVTVEKGSLLYELYGRKDRVFVNTYHHQAIKDLAPALIAAAHSDDGIIEAVYMSGKPYVFGVQWHPEKLFDEGCSKLFDFFIKEAESK